jgi:regulatory protein
MESGGERGRSDETDGLAPVIPLFGGRDLSAQWDATWSEATHASASSPRGDAEPRSARGRERRAPAELSGAEAVDAAETALTRKLSSRQLSVAEARAVLREREVEPDAAAEIVERFEQRGYLDDARLAEQLVHAAVTRKGQGRQAIAMTLTKRGIPRAVVDLALQTLPDDDVERALEYARTKVRRTGDLDRDTALRRLVGQLTRRGYPSSAALTAARTALDERV